MSVTGSIVEWILTPVLLDLSIPQVLCFVLILDRYKNNICRSSKYMRVIQHPFVHLLPMPCKKEKT